LRAAARLFGAAALGAALLCGVRMSYAQTLDSATQQRAQTGKKKLQATPKPRPKPAPKHKPKSAAKPKTPA
jgi:hypothetical protein